MSLLQTVGIFWVLVTSVAGHIMFAALAFAGARAIRDYIRDLEEHAQMHKPEVVRRATSG